jgi:PhnB protein
MQTITGYLFFDGNAREAMEHYRQCLKGTLEVTTFGEGACSTGEAKDRVMHARLTLRSSLLMASDTMPGMPFVKGNGFAIALACESMSEINTVFDALSAGGKVTKPLGDMPWGAHFGMLTDKFGTEWMLSFEKSPRQ